MKIKNSRTISKSEIHRMASWLKQFGWRQPIVVDLTGVVIDGRMRWLAARKLGLERVPRLGAVRPRSEYPKEGKQQ